MRLSGHESQQRVLIALKNGAVTIYNLKKRNIEFKTEAGHSETIFETEFCKSNSDYVASCSYDGTVRLWDTATMKLVCTNDTARGTPQSKLEKKIIYSISWHPTQTKIAMVTVNGNLMVYDALKSKYLGSVTPFEGVASFKVAWNQKKPSTLLMSS